MQGHLRYGALKARGLKPLKQRGFKALLRNSLVAFLQCWGLNSQPCDQLTIASNIQIVHLNVSFSVDGVAQRYIFWSFLTNANSLCNSQLVRKLRAEHRVNHDSVPPKQRGLRAFLKDPTLTV